MDGRMMRSDKKTNMIQNSQQLHASPSTQKSVHNARLRKSLTSYHQLGCVQLATFIFLAFASAGTISALKHAGSQQQWPGIVVALPMFVAFVLGIVTMRVIGAQMKRDGLVSLNDEPFHRFR